MKEEQSLANHNYIDKVYWHFLILFFICYITTDINAQYAKTIDFIFVQVPQYTNSDKSRYENISSISDRYVKSARIVNYNLQSNTIKNLTQDFFAACDPDISFDGLNIIFSGKINENDYWQIWSMKSDGSHKKQITRASGDCMMPVYAGNRFYLNDPQPTPQIVYAGNEHAWYNNIESRAILALYGTDHQGKNTYRLTYNLYSDYSPDVLPDGRIVFSSWQPSAGGKLALMAVNVDGTDLMPYYGNHELPLFKEMVHASEYDNRVYYIESDEQNWPGGGDIAEVSHRRPLNSYRKTIIAEEGLYHSPCPMPDGGLLASYRSNSKEAEFAVYQLDPSSGDKIEKIYGEAGWHTIDTQILTSHTPAKGRSNWLIPGATTAVFYCMDSYRTNLDTGKNISPGDIKYVRIIEGLPKKEMQKPDQINPNSLPARVLGVAPVENDGSFHVRVPAEVPLSFHLLNKNKMKIRTQEGWTWAMGNENRGCIGCHENRELSPPNILVNAIVKPPVDLTDVPENTNPIDFRHKIAPMLMQKCAIPECHGSGHILSPIKDNNSSGRDFSYEDFYLDLLAWKNADDKTYIVPGWAINSSLTMDIILTDHLKDTSEISEPPVHKNDILSEKEKMLLIEWIDMGAPYDLTPYLEKVRTKKEN